MRRGALSHRRLGAGVVLAVLVALAVPVLALGASPLAGKLYTGTGVDRLNNAPTWTRDVTLPRQPFHFHVSAGGKAVLTFRGRFFFFCGSGTAVVRAARITIHRTGKFAYRFWQPTREPNGTISGRTYVSISGSFTHHGQTANVSYLVVYGTTHPAHDPYTPAGALRDGCGSWVKGTASAS